MDGSLALPYTVTAEQPQNGTGRQEVETTLENLQVVAALVGCDYGSVRGFGPVKAFKALQDAGDGGSERLLALVKERVAKEEDAACINAVLHQFQRARTNGFDEFSLTPLPAPEGTLSAAVKINETNMGYLIQLLYVAEHPEIANSWIQGSPLLPAVPPELPVPCKLVLTPSDIQDSDIPGVWSDDVCAWPITRKKRLLKIYSVRTAWGVGWTHAQRNRHSIYDGTQYCGLHWWPDDFVLPTNHFNSNDTLQRCSGYKRVRDRRDPLTPLSANKRRSTNTGATRTVHSENSIVRRLL